MLASWRNSRCVRQVHTTWKQKCRDSKEWWCAAEVGCWCYRLKNSGLIKGLPQIICYWSSEIPKSDTMVTWKNSSYKLFYRSLKKKKAALVIIFMWLNSIRILIQLFNFPWPAYIWSILYFFLFRRVTQALAYTCTEARSLHAQKIILKAAQGNLCLLSIILIHDFYSL